MASRHKARVVALQGLYQIELTATSVEEVVQFHWYDKELEEGEKELGERLIRGVVKNWELLDTIIRTYSKNRGFDRISIINRCILRISIYTLINLREIPGRVVINEAIELTREFESEDSVGFINGILDAVYKDDLAKTSGEV